MFLVFKLLIMNYILNQMKYKIKEGQTILDVVNQLYTNTDNVCKIYEDNSLFDLNNITDTVEVEYTPVKNDISNEISNNNYEFNNRENVVYQLFDTITLNKQKYNFNSYSSFYGKMYYYNVNTKEYGYVIDNEYIYILENNTVLKLYKENI